MGPKHRDDVVAKGPVTYCLDEISVAATAREQLTALHQHIADLSSRNFQGLEAVFAKDLFPDFYSHEQIEKLTTYLHTYWFNPISGWWPTQQPIAPIYAQGLLHALTVSLATPGLPRPIDSYWVVGHTHVEMITLASPRQVTLVIATPHPDASDAGLAPGGVLSASAEAWVTSRRAGVSDTEIDPATGAGVVGSAELRVRTVKIHAHAPRGASLIRQALIG